MSKVVELSDSNFEQEVIKSETPVLVDFYAEWCGPCKMQHPAIEKISEMFEGKVKIGKLNVDEARKKAAEFNVRSIPTLVVFKKGEVVERVMGYHTAERLASILNKHI